jgi:hypothetical protein
MIKASARDDAHHKHDRQRGIGEEKGIEAHGRKEK